MIIKIVCSLDNAENLKKKLKCIFFSGNRGIGGEKGLPGNIGIRGPAGPSGPRGRAGGSGEKGMFCF